MKQIEFNLLLLLLFLNSCSVNSKTCPVNALAVKNEKLSNILNDIHNQRLQNEDWKNVILVLKIANRKADSTKLRISIINKNDIAWYLHDKKDNSIGFFVNQSDTVLVFGDYNESLVNLTGQKKAFDFIPCSGVTKNNIPHKSQNAEPPVSFEPQVWEYNFFQGNIIFKEKGMLDLLE